MTVLSAQAIEAAIEHIFRFAHVYSGAAALPASGCAGVKPLITDRYPFGQAVEAFAYALKPRPDTVKILIRPGDKHL